ncbi:MAG: hypothetical protein GX925_02610 [Clostridiales bacterium]|nr:hypothetical protein [Clostridiales bacterium]
MSEDITNEQLFEFMTRIYSNLDKKIGSLDERIGDINKEMQEGFKEMKNEIKKVNIKIDHEIVPKIDALFDGYKQNSDKYGQD